VYDTPQRSHSAEEEENEGSRGEISGIPHDGEGLGMESHWCGIIAVWALSFIVLATAFLALLPVTGLLRPTTRPPECGDIRSLYFDLVTLTGRAVTIPASFMAVSPLWKSYTDPDDSSFENFAFCAPKSSLDYSTFNLASYPDILLNSTLDLCDALDGQGVKLVEQAQKDVSPNPVPPNWSSIFRVSSSAQWRG